MNSWLISSVIVIVFCIIILYIVYYLNILNIFKIEQKLHVKQKIHNAIECIGEQVCKRSNKPFKSGAKINTVKGVTTNPYTGNEAFEFEEDDSIVDVWKCKLYNN